MKYFNIKRYKFSTVPKKISTLVYNFFKFIDIIRYGLVNFFNRLDVKKFDFRKIKKYFDAKQYNFSKIRRINFLSNKLLFFHLPASIIFFGFLYFLIPIFYSYDKSSFEKLICKKNNIECFIKGKVSYSFFPSPRIKIENLIVNDSFENKDVLLKTEQVVINLSIKNLLAKEKHKLKQINLYNYEINYNLKNFKKYRDIFFKKNDFLPVAFNNGRILFFDGKNYVAAINDANFKLNFTEVPVVFTLKGNFLKDNIFVKMSSENIDNKIFTDIILKMPGSNFITKAKIINSEQDKNTTTGNFLIKKGKNRITSIFDYKDNKLILNKSNLRSPFFEGGLSGVVEFLPFFNFNLEIDLNSINFTKAYNHFLSLDEIGKKNIFKINKKINGKLNLSSDKIYSKHNLIKSFESRLKFNNGNILIEQFLINLGKLGASDILGSLNNDQKYTNFKFESNIFVDNQKKFLSKFGIYNKKNISPNLFVSGNFDLENLRFIFYEMSAAEKLNKEDVNYIEKEFNNLMLEDGYKSLFDFPNFKEFIKSITSTAS